MMGRKAACGRRRVASLAFAALLLVSLAVGGQDTSGSADGRVQLATQPVRLADFSLTDQDNRPARLSDLDGHTKLVFFGFTHCQSVCPPTLQKLRQVCRSLTADDEKFRCVMISVDGERDTPAVMKEYLAPFQPGFVGLTGSPATVRDIAAQFSAVFFKGMPRPANGYDVEHTSQVYLVDRQGQLRATFYNAAADAMIATAREVMKPARHSADASTHARASGSLR